MHFKLLSVAVAALSGSLVLTASAEPLKGEAELGYVQTTGNSETTNINAKLKLLKETEHWEHEANFSGLGNSSTVKEDDDNNPATPKVKRDETTAEKYRADLKSDRKLDDRSSLFVLSTYDKDRFGAFDHEVTAGIGYGYKVIAEDDMKLKFEIGPGYRFNAGKDGNSDEEELTVRLAEKFKWKFSESAELDQYIVSEGGDENTITTAGISVKSALTGSLALKVGVNYKYTDEVPADTEHADTETFANISYNF